MTQFRCDDSQEELEKVRKRQADRETEKAQREEELVSRGGDREAIWG